jgi:hypothetical protein
MQDAAGDDRIRPHTLGAQVGRKQGLHIIVSKQGWE